MRIYKYALDLSQLDDRFAVQMPASAKVLSAQNQGEKLCIWAVVDPTEPPADRCFLALGTGNPLPPLTNARFIGTAQFMDGNFVIHIFEA